MILQTMHLLPNEDTSISTLVSTLPTASASGKRKAIDYSPPVKKLHVEESDSDSEIYDMVQCKYYRSYVVFRFF